MLCHFNHCLFKLFVIVSLFPLFLFFSQNNIFWHAGQNILKAVQANDLKFSGVL